MPDADPLTILIDGRRYGGWIAPTITRAIDQCASTFEVEHSATWMGADASWPLTPWSEVQVLVGDDPLVTGYLDVLEAGLGPEEETMRFAGRSRTCDLVDCVTEIKGGEFRGGTLAAMARALCAKFSIEVVDEARAGKVFPVQRVEPTDRAFSFLEELGRMRGVLLTDDEKGRLVLTRSGTNRASGALRLGDNIMQAQLRTNVSKRFSRYIARSQLGLASSIDIISITGEHSVPGGGVANGVAGVATDPQVPRYRPMAVSSEGATDNAGALERARWEAAARAGQAVEVTITVPGWRQRDGRLWRINELVPVSIGPWQLDEEMLVAGTTFTLDESQERVTQLRLGPPAGFTPEPLAQRSSAGNTNFLAMLLPNSGNIPEIPGGST